MRSFLVLVSLPLVIAACSNADETDEVEPQAELDAELKNVGTQQAEGIDCPSKKVDSTSAKNEITGVQIGMTAQQAYEAVACADPDYKVRYSDFGFELPAIPDGSEPKRGIYAEKGLENISIFLMGLPGKERVIGISRYVEFPQGKEPTIKNLVESLTKKYGTYIPS